MSSYGMSEAEKKELEKTLAEVKEVVERIERRLHDRYNKKSMVDDKKSMVDDKRKRSGSNDSDSNWSTEAVYNEGESKEAIKWKAVWEVATDKEKNDIWEIVKRGAKWEARDPRGEEPKYYWDTLVIYATEQEKKDIQKIWERTSYYKRKKAKLEARKKEGLRF